MTLIPVTPPTVEPLTAAEAKARLGIGSEMEVCKYRRWYDQIVSRGQARHVSGYTERHHIVPRSLGGSNLSANMVTLSYREHFLVHWLLTKFTFGADRKKMLHAFAHMTRMAGKRGEAITSWQYAISKKAYHFAMLGSKASEKSRQKMSANHGKHTKETYKKIGDTLRAKKRPQHIIDMLTGRPCSAETRRKIGAANSGKIHTEEAKKKIGAASSLKRFNHTDEAKQKIAAWHMGRGLSEEVRRKISETKRRKFEDRIAQCP